MNVYNLEVEDVESTDILHVGVCSWSTVTPKIHSQKPHNELTDTATRKGEAIHVLH
jgi:hypothetical protein